MCKYLADLINVVYPTPLLYKKGKRGIEKNKKLCLALSTTYNSLVVLIVFMQFLHEMPTHLKHTKGTVYFTMTQLKYAWRDVPDGWMVPASTSRTLSALLWSKGHGFEFNVNALIKGISVTYILSENSNQICSIWGPVNQWVHYDFL